MKYLILMVSCIFITINVQAQCPDNNTLTAVAPSDLTPTGQGNTQTSCCVWAGEYVTLNVVSGTQYRIATCGGASPSGMGAGSEITVRNNAGGGLLTSSDADNCTGFNETFDWTATLSGTVKVLIDGDNTGANSCTHDATNRNLSITQITALPVNLVYFDARSSEHNSIILKWETSAELNNDRFEIYKSRDGISFKPIAFVKGAGTTLETQTYEYEDTDVLPNRPYYYRLRQVDFDGTYEDTDVVSSLVSDKSLPFSGNLSPNPAKDKTYLQYNATLQDITITAIDLDGKIKMTQVYHPKSIGYTLIPIDLTAIEKSGIYLLSIESDGQRFTKKLFINR